MTYYAALDVSLRSVAICIVDDDGMVKLERAVLSEVADIANCLRAVSVLVSRTLTAP